MQFEWTAEKAATNLVRHNVSFEEASSIFGDPLSTTVIDQQHSRDEVRFLTTGLSNQGKLLIVWHTDRDEVIRIIGAREASGRERRVYESGE